MTELLELKHEVNVMRTEVNALQKSQEFFQQTVLKDMEQRNKEQHNIYTLIDRQRGAIENVPKEVSANMKACQKDIEERAAEKFAAKSNVITPATLRNILFIITVGFTGASWLFQQLDDAKRENAIAKGIQQQFEKVVP